MRRGLRSVFIIALITVLLFVALELIARIVLWRTDTSVEQSAGFGFSQTGYGDLAPNLDSVERILPNRPYHLKTNSTGLRDMDEVSDDPAVFRVLALGDSFTYGYYVHNEEAWPARLEETLNQRLSTRFQVLNAGVPGFTIVDELQYLREKGLALEPDLVVIGFYTNDIFDFYPQIREYFARPVILQQAVPSAPQENNIVSFLRQNSALFNILLRLRGGFSQQQIESEINHVTPTIPGLQELYRDMLFLNPRKPEYQEEWDSYTWYFKEAVDLLAQKAIPLVLLAFPDLAELPIQGGLPDYPQQFLAQLTTDVNTPYLDLLPVFRKQGDIQSLYLMYFNPDAQVDPNAPDSAVQSFTGDGHPSAYGHLVTARALADLLITRGLVPE
jgi:lysophospholipase L1-like esterase